MDRAENQDEFRVEMPSTPISFSKYSKWLIEDYKKRKCSIFVDGLVGGLLISFVVDNPMSCHDKAFTGSFFIIAILHLTCKLLIMGCSSYAKGAAELDGVVTKMEKLVVKIADALIHLVRLAQYPAWVLLGYFVFKISIVQRQFWTSDRAEISPKGADGDTCLVCFCMGSYVELAKITFFTQLAIGIFEILFLSVLWAFQYKEDRKVKWVLSKARRFVDWSQENGGIGGFGT